jgi:hypothetical protein
MKPTQSHRTDVDAIALSQGRRVSSPRKQSAVQSSVDCPACRLPACFMHVFGAVHRYMFMGGDFWRNPKPRPCMISGKSREERGLQPILRICPRTTKIARNQHLIRSGVAVIVPQGIRTEDHRSYHFSAEGVFIVCEDQPVSMSSLGAPSYCGTLPERYVLEARECAANCPRWWREQRNRNPRPQY